MAESGVPILCTLHPNELGGRLEEWHRLFAGHLAGIQRPAPTRLRLLLAADAGLERTRELAAREMACCAFMTFTVIPAGGRLLVDVEVPAAAAPTLDGLAGIAERAALAEHRRGTGELQRRARRKVAEVDARIGQLQQVREALLAVAAADCASLTDCSCGLGGPLPALEPTGPDRDQR